VENPGVFHSHSCTPLTRYRRAVGLHKRRQAEGTQVNWVLPLPPPLRFLTTRADQGPVGRLRASSEIRCGAALHPQIRAIMMRHLAAKRNCPLTLTASVSTATLRSKPA